MLLIFVDPPYEGDEVVIVGSSGISDKVRSRKGTAVRAAKAPPKRKGAAPVPPLRVVDT